MSTDGIPTARVPSRPYAGGRYGIRRTGTTEYLPLKRPFGSVSAVYVWLDRSGYSLGWESCPWAEYMASEQYAADRA